MNIIAMKKQSQNQDINFVEFFCNDSIEKAAELYKELQRPIMSGADLGITLPVLGHWVKQLDEKTIPRRKYSLTDYVWYKLVEQLRNAGLSFTAIRNLKEQLLSEVELKGIITKLQQAKEYIDSLKLSNEQKKHLEKLIGSSDSKITTDQTSFSIIHIMIMESVLTKLPLNVAVFLDGTFTVLDKSKEHLYSTEEKERLLYETYISVSISAILKKFLYTDVSGFVIPQIGLFSYAENKLFEVVHSGDYEQIIISFKDKKTKSLELKKSEDVKKHIVDILQSENFGSIIVKKHNGIITKIENTIKVTL